MRKININLMQLVVALQSEIYERLFQFRNASFYQFIYDNFIGGAQRRRARNGRYISFKFIRPWNLIVKKSSLLLMECKHTILKKVFLMNVYHGTLFFTANQRTFKGEQREREIIPKHISYIVLRLS